MNSVIFIFTILMSEQEIYSELILELYQNPVNRGELPNHNLALSGGNPLCGDEVQFQLLVKDNRVQDIRFTSQGCAISTASSSLLTELVKGKTVDEILALKDQDMFSVLGNIIQTRLKCALLGLSVVQKGLRQWQQNPTQTKLVTGIKI